jgi:hypothetical protein
VYRSVFNADWCMLLQCDIGSMQIQSLDKGTKLSVGGTTSTIIHFTRKTNSTNFNYKLCRNLVSRSQCFKGLGILLDCKVYLHNHVGYIFTQGFEMLRFLFQLSIVL